ncbi:unnamed protein product, partial [Didymodactylos carnosus]
LPSVKLHLSNEVDYFETDHVDNTNEHDGRKRLFAHERGNWATSIFAFVYCSSHMDTLIDDYIDLMNQMLNSNNDAPTTMWKRVNELHVSVSKTFPVRYHHIEALRITISEEFKSFEKFSSAISNIDILSNEDGSTSFLVFTLDQCKRYSDIVKKVDKALVQYRLPVYYENPCFHTSIAYIAGDKRYLMTNEWKLKCQALLNEYNCIPSATTISIEDIRLKAGNRVYHLFDDKRT